jgi:hypothetical protein
VSDRGILHGGILTGTFKAAFKPDLASFRGFCLHDWLSRMSLRLTQKQRFQFETATSTFLENLLFYPIDFATLEIERHETPATIRGRFPFTDRFFANRFHKATRFS